MRLSPAVIALIAILLIPVAGLAYSISSNAKKKDAMPTPTPSPTARAVPTEADAVSAHEVILSTDKGDIRITLFPEEAPKTVKNFVTLGTSGYYDGIIFHRVIGDFMIQGGDPTGTGTGGESIYGRRFEDEIGSRKIVKGTVAMANAGQNTNGSQFFIVTQKDQPGLDGGYTVFGKVADEASMQVVQAIGGVPTDPQTDRPLVDVRMTGMKITQE